MKKVLTAIGVSLLPLVALAQDLSGIENLADSIGNIVGTLIPIVFAIILLVFFWGLARYVFAAGSEDSKAEGKRLMIGGIIALFVAAAIWGIVEFIGTLLGVDTDEEINAPGVGNLN